MTIYIDITNLMQHRWVLSGIQRIIYQLIRYYSLNKQVRFVCWSKKRTAFVLVPRASLQALLDRVDNFETPQTSSPAQPANFNLLKRLRRKLIHSGRQAIAVMPPALRLRALIRRWFLAETLPGIKQPVICDFGQPSCLIIPYADWHNPLQAKAILKLSLHGVKLAQIIHDMIPVVTPEYLHDNRKSAAFRDFMLATLPVTDAIMAISKNTATDVSRLLELGQAKAGGKISVFQLGDSPISPSLKLNQPKLATDRPYILSVGTVEIRKNHQLLLEAYRLAQAKGIDLPQLYIAGRLGWKVTDLVETIKSDPYIKTKVRIIEQPNDSELGWLYSNAQLTVFPSFYEGWGLPITESLAFGKVTLSSNTSSMPEAGGSLADYFSPHSAQELLDLLVIYQDEATRKEQEAEIGLKFKGFSWQQSISQFDQVLMASLTS